ncbi:hypothetical protein FISHEDRAFT_58529 [Fistulina hepatica ATCC 64428]|uniref:Uncharacterized protein n=1 Tax=Fistulina hepatica ATCC 64428 TaxID=1128425 RepID=A0A0D7AF82_9AGAR|nr:hypothetical protein FISHEDRAFT_58529 [Fistulina hepatica ATCC 64428]
MRKEWTTSSGEAVHCANLVDVCAAGGLAQSAKEFSDHASIYLISVYPSLFSIPELTVVADLGFSHRQRFDSPPSVSLVSNVDRCLVIGGREETGTRVVEGSVTGFRRHLRCCVANGAIQPLFGTIDVVLILHGGDITKFSSIVTRSDLPAPYRSVVSGFGTSWFLPCHLFFDHMGASVPLWDVHVSATMYFWLSMQQRCYAARRLYAIISDRAVADVLTELDRRYGSVLFNYMTLCVVSAIVLLVHKMMCVSFHERVCPPSDSGPCQSIHVLQVREAPFARDWVGIHNSAAQPFQSIAEDALAASYIVDTVDNRPTVDSGNLAACNYGIFRHRSPTKMPNILD